MFDHLLCVQLWLTVNFGKHLWVLTLCQILACQIAVNTRLRICNTEMTMKSLFSLYVKCLHYLFILEDQFFSYVKFTLNIGFLF